MLLEHIVSPAAVKDLSYEELDLLAAEIRKFIIEKTSRTGGHLASNLGVVELTLALFRVLDLPTDKIIWDVGHQSYTHKLLTGRREGFDGLRQFGGMSGFPKHAESPYDAFDTGHSSTSISAGLGIAQARDLKGEAFTVVSVIGDGALTGGMAFEALNNAAHIKKNFIIVLNDNEMSIAHNVGGISNYLNGLRTGSRYNRLKKTLVDLLDHIPGAGPSLTTHLKRAKDGIKGMIVPGMLFEDMGITYLGPVDGHDIRAVEKVIRQARQVDHAVLVHVCTVKGKGYAPAEADPSSFHGVDPFDISTGRKLAPSAGPSYTSVFSRALIEAAEKDASVVALTAAMPDGTGLKAFEERFPERFFDVGIAEAHAVTSAAGMASQGLRPVFAVYSSFLQRGYDQIVHDVCLQNLPVVFAVDRAGLVGADGETHQGIFDLSYLTHIPNMTVMAPKNAAELPEMLKFALSLKGPSAIRYPRGTAYTGLSEFHAPIAYGKAERIYEGGRIALMALGSMVSCAVHIYEKLAQRGICTSLINLRFAKPLDLTMIGETAGKADAVVVLEENVERGGIGEQIEAFLHETAPGVRVLKIALPDAYVEHGDVTRLREMLGIDSDSIIRKMEEAGIIPGDEYKEGSAKTGDDKDA